MYLLIALIAIALGAAGLYWLTPATLGLGLVGLSIVFALLARLSQAETYQKRWLEALEDGELTKR